MADSLSRGTPTREQLLRQGESRLHHDRYWTGPVLNGVQYGWAVATASGPFGEPPFRGWGTTMAEAEADLAVEMEAT